MQIVSNSNGAVALYPLMSEPASKDLQKSRLAELEIGLSKDRVRPEDVLFEIGVVVAAHLALALAITLSLR